MFHSKVTFPIVPEEIRTFEELSIALARYPSEAHHPTCQFHQDHIINIRGKLVCLGCWCLNLGCIFSIPFIFVLHYIGLEYYSLMLIGFLLFTPTLFQLKIQWKPFKIFSRTSLGVGSGLFLLSCLFLAPYSFLGLLIRISSIAFFIVVAKTSLKLRSRHSNSPCKDCSEGSFPYCTYKMTNMERILEMNTLETVPEEFLKSIVSGLKAE